jgi:hypothetical protein
MKAAFTMSTGLDEVGMGRQSGAIRVEEATPWRGLQKVAAEPRMRGGGAYGSLMGASASMAVCCSGVN